MLINANENEMTYDAANAVAPVEVEKTDAEKKQEMRDLLEQTLLENGKTEEEVARTLADYDATMARAEAIEAAGLKVTYRKHLIRVSNVRWHYGRLQDGTCHYQHQTTVAGNTFPVKDALKAAGYRWDAGDKLWYRPMGQDGRRIIDHLEDAKNLVHSLI